MSFARDRWSARSNPPLAPMLATTAISAISITTTAATSTLVRRRGWVLCGLRHILLHHRQSLSTTSTPQRRRSLLVRDYVDACLYNERCGYFANASQPPLQPTPEQPFDFQAFENRAAYQVAVARRYGSHPRAWATPVELFHPFYGRAIARHLLAQHDEQHGRRSDATTTTTTIPPSPFRIVEVGGGNGTLAEAVMEYISSERPELLRTMSYDIVEHSAPLAARQRTRLSSWIDRGIVRIHQDHVVRWLNDDRSHQASRGASERDRECRHFVLLEVLDNMPHDLVCGSQVARRVFDREGISQLQQARVCIEQGPEHLGGARIVDENELLMRADTKRFMEAEPLSDPLIIRACEAWTQPLEHTTDLLDHTASTPAATTTMKISTRASSNLFGMAQRLLNAMLSTADDEWYVPTTAHAMLEAIAARFDNHSITIADFHALPDVLTGRNGPVLQRLTPDHRAVSFESLVLPSPGSCDIMFPTDFACLAAAHRHVCADDARDWHGWVLPSEAFLQRYAESDRTATRSGFNPMLHDFTNTSIFFGRARMPC